MLPQIVVVLVLVIRLAWAESGNLGFEFGGDPERVEFAALARWKGTALERGVFVGEITVPPAGFLSRRGRIGQAIEAASGERLEVRWEGLLPRYGLYYFRSPLSEGVRIGRCHFSYGCNRSFYLAEVDGGGKGLARFLLVQWTSLDFGYDQGVPGYLDRYRHIFDPLSGEYVLYHDLLLYRCDAPLGSPPDICAGRCEPPFRTAARDGSNYPLIYKSDIQERTKPRGLDRRGGREDE